MDVRGCKEFGFFLIGVFLKLQPSANTLSFQLGAKFKRIVALAPSLHFTSLVVVFDVHDTLLVYLLNPQFNIYS